MVISSVLPSTDVQDYYTQFNVHIPASVPVSKVTSKLATPSTTITSVSSTFTSSRSSPPVASLPSVKTKVVSLKAYKSKPVKEVSNRPHFATLLSTSDSSTSGVDVKEVYLPPIPENLVDLQDYIRTLCDVMDRVGRLREAAELKLDVLRKEGTSLQREKELRRKLESENRELKRQLAETKWRKNLFPDGT
ncbi:unnamed protein product [Mytilus coruscus]|uniref:Uncharacterized protein n=1 Tax=Mytilus coruscus TaxID=42192 RepID=A0A6J8A797_MYTCO|nr:unnamed protein product [Mytilus coruscus]